MQDFTLWGLTGAAVTGLVLEALKQIWQRDGQPVIKDRWAVVAAVVVGVVLSIAAYIASISPDFSTWLEVIGAGVMAGLTACGLYSVTKAR